MPGYVEADLIQARKPITDQSGRGLAYCVLGHLEVEQREAASSDRAEAIRALQLNIATFDGVEPEAEDVPTDPTPEPQPTAGGPTPTPASPPIPPAPPPAHNGHSAYAQSRDSMRRILTSAGIAPVGEQQTPAETARGDTSLGASMRRTLARMGVQPTRGA